MHKLRGFFTRLPRALALVYGLFAAFILCLLTFCEKQYGVYFGSDRPISNLGLMGVVLCLLALGAAAWRLFGRQGTAPVPAGEGKKRVWLLCAVYGALFALQCVMARCLWFYQGFDASNVRLWSAALALGQPVDGEYYRLCPNNAPLTALLALPYWVGAKLGLAEPYVLEVYCGALCVNLSALTTTLCVRRLTQSRLTRGLTFAASTLWLVFSPYITVPYTDSFAVLFPILTVYIMLSSLKAPWKYGLAALVSSLGAAVKPSALIALIAVLLLGAFRALARLPWDRAFLRRGLAALLAVALGYLPGRLLQDGATTLLAGSAKPEEMLGTAHYLMIGTDDRYWGGHSVEGLAYSQSFDALEERNAANLRAAWENVAGRSLGQNLYFFSVKAYKAYADGSFAWNGSSMRDSVPKRTDALSKALRSVFYYDGQWNPWYCTLAQGIWFITLILCGLGAVAGRKRYPVQLLALCLLGVTGYQLLFEVWPRYLFLYLPLFITLGALGLERLLQKQNKNPVP